MSLEKVKAYFEEYGIADQIIELKTSTATVELAAQALGVAPERIAKSLSFATGEKTTLVVTAGDARIDNAKFKSAFQTKAKMLSRDEVEERIGHAVGGVCPFAVNDGVEVWLDQSLKRFETVFPAAGSINSAIQLTLEQLERYSKAKGWVDVTK